MRAGSQSVTKKAVHLTSVHIAVDTRILHRECESLARAGFAVVLVAAHPRDETIKGVQIRALKRPRSRLLRMTGSVWRAYRIAVREGPAVFHLHDPELLPIVPLLRARGWPVIYDAHEVLPHQIRDKFWIPAMLRPIAAGVGRLLERWADFSCSAIIGATPDIIERFQRNAAVLIKNYPDKVEFRDASGAPYGERDGGVAYVGAIEANRGAIEMVRAIGLVSAQPGAMLTLAGDIRPDVLRTTLAGTAGWERCRTPGRLHRPEVARLLAESRVGLVVLHPTDSYPRNYPVKMFEYMAAGLPIVASDFPLWRELLGPSDCAVFVDPLDPGAIAAAIQELLGDPKRAGAMAERGRVAVTRDFTWATQEVQLLALYDRLWAGIAAPKAV